MRTKIIMLLVIGSLFAVRANAQWVVSDPGNLAQGIINASKNIVQTSSTAQNMIKNFQETVKIYQQGKEYYDRLKSVHNLVKDARKVQKSILLIGEISDIYVNSFQKMLSDENYTPDELSAIAYGYTQLLQESSDVLEEMKSVVNINGLSMSDKERMDVIDRTYNAIRNYRDLVSYYTRKNISVSYLRAKKKKDTDRVMALYVAAKVWQSLASAEPIDVYPLLRPFVIGFCIMFFPTFVLGTINSVMSPVVRGCNNMLETQTFDMNAYREQKDKLEYEAMVRNPETAYLVSDEAFDKQIDELGWSAKDIATMGGMYMDRAAHNIKQSVRDWFRELLELLFQSAALVIDTIRTFFLIVLAILGPIAFAISVYDGFQATLTQWITRYISVYLWLPVSDLFSSILARIQVLMLQKDIQELSDPNFIPDGSNSVYIIFMIIGIIGYFTIPTVSNWIIQAGGMGNMSRNINSAANKTGSGVGAVAGAATGNAGGRVGGKLIKSNQ